MKDRLENHIRNISNPALQDTCEVLLEDLKFKDWPASLSYHHAYEGGLLAHTVEVVDIAEHIWRFHERSLRETPDILTAAALYHDLMKIEEYSLVTSPTHLGHDRFLATPGGGTYWVKLDPTQPHRHIQQSADRFAKVAASFNVPGPILNAVHHCILAHHGPVKEWGSPVAPKTLEALILHQADMLSAGYGATKGGPL